jgi:hypothetical protein
MSEIKTNFELPRGDDDTKYTQRVAQDLSKNFKAIRSIVNQITSSINALEQQKKYVDVNLHFTSIYQTLTATHNLGVIPTGWYVIDQYWGGTNFNQAPLIYRTAWTASTITLQVGNTIDSYVKIRVFI